MSLDRGLDWVEKSSQALKRDKNQCALCSNKKGLSVHHITPYKKTKDNSLINLITVCRKCHAREENEFRRFNAPSLKIRNWLKNCSCKC